MDAALLLAVRMIVSAAVDTTPPTLPTFTQTDSCTPGMEPSGAVLCLNRQALDQEQRGEFAAASKTLEEADRLWTREPKPRASLRATILSNLGETYEQLGRWRDARECFRNAMAVNEDTFGHGDVHTAYSMVRLASIEMMMGDPARAEELLNTALPMERRALPDSAMELSGALSFAAMFELQKGNIAEAARLAQEGVAVAKSRNVESPEYAASLTTLAGVYIIEHDTTRATPLLNRGVDILERRLGPNHPRLAPVLMDRAMIYQGDGKAALAEADATRALGILSRESGPDSIGAAWAQTRLSSVYLDEDKTKEAEEILPQAVERQRRFYDRPNWRVAASIGELARLRAAQSRTSEAEDLYRESLAMFDAVAPNNPEAARAMRDYADLLRADGGSRREIRRLMAKAKSILSTNDILSR
jgi:tetratricopeptide (TPR) repeat protein